MLSEAPPPPSEIIAVPEDTGVIAGGLPAKRAVDGTLVIDLMPLAPSPPGECLAEEPDPLNPQIIVCRQTVPSQRLGPVVGPIDDGFGSAMPRARFKLSDKAALELNGTSPSVGGFNAQGGEVRLKVDF
jgi:hypothetical protein